MFSEFTGDILKKLKENGYEYTWGNVTVKLAEAYGFCWGVERAVQIAYEARKQFPAERIWITNEIIHNPTVNQVPISFNVDHVLRNSMFLDMDDRRGKKQEFNSSFMVLCVSINIFVDFSFS